MFELTGKVAIVTGAGSAGPGWGNGRATAVLLARQGAALFAIDLNLEAADATRGLIEAEGGTCAAHRCDMTAGREVQAAVDACVRRFGRVDILVNNVGGSAPGDAAAMPEEVWDAQVALNLKTAFLGCKYVLSVMAAQGAGAIVNTSSVAGLRSHLGRPHVAYSATKAGVIALSRSTAIAYAKRGIRCNTVVPGLMHTPLVEHRLARQLGYRDAAALVAERHAMVPVGRMGDAWDVAHAVLYLVSDEARYVTGTELVVDGGLTASLP
jgi:NAD(P)-dependent dehydrogenase (short-subunit alcohol dehydrogenase family)